MKSIDRYMARLIALPLFATLVIAAMLLVLDRIRRLFDFVATQGGPISVVWRMLANLLPEYLGLGIPIGLMLGILLAFRRLATSSELDVMRGVGMSYTRLLRVPYLYAIVLAALNLAIVGYVQPIARYYYEGLRYELRTGALGASIKVGEFTHLGDRMTLRIEESRDKGRDLSGIFVHAQTGKGDWIGVTAERGRFLATDDPNVIIFRLTNGTLIHDRQSFRAPRVLTFSSHDLPIDLPKFENFRQRGGRDLEFTLPELARHGQEAQSEEARDGSRAEFHFRLVEVVTMFLLPLLAVALGIPPKRSTSALGVFLSIVMLVTYHKVNQYAADIGALGRVDPLIALWGPFAIFAGIVVWMYYVTAYVPGGQPIGILERSFAKLAKLFTRWLPGPRRRAREMRAREAETKA
ncbi:LPS export ABC transporter permease LptF [Sphingomonas carotinifaciens]|uniref:Lipopolysaccharide export system permease protein n=2 Tax=Sphingomonas carotinifaciens TaxID=1166323 RepID=A0A1G7J6P1_9SPHN|nr:LPS export ABC transporter permease LptF [Sphingomonas carotinifaciens]MBB4084610.1 lipopolysaccharide export system permease protein [Sphingomonas carotinifaciens]SDF20590.1 lipopolysaccharide export system permease protein [Sphingomonas carotinifaciens]